MHSTAVLRGASLAERCGAALQLQHKRSTAHEQAGTPWTIQLAHGSINVRSVQGCERSCSPPQVFGYPGQAPIAGTEGEFSASVIGCTYYIVVAVIWSMIWCVAFQG